MRAWQTIDKIRSDISADYATHQPSAVELSRVRSSLHALRAAACHLADAARLTSIGETLALIESQLVHAALAEAQAFRRRHPLSGRGA